MPELQSESLEKRLRQRIEYQKNELHRRDLKIFDLTQENENLRISLENMQTELKQLLTDFQDLRMKALSLLDEIPQ